METNKLNEMFGLSGRRALVTGASAGIGEACAKALAEAGAEVICVSRREPDVVRYIRAAGGQAHSLCADLSDVHAAEDVINTAEREYGNIDILLNNAGAIRRADATDYTEEDWDYLLDLNLKSVFLMSRAAARGMLARGYGKIICTASLLSFQGGVRVAAYTASKSGLVGVVRLLSNEWAGRGVCVNAIAPGYIETDNTAALRKDEKRSAEILARIPAGRWGKAGDIGGTAVFLASHASDYLTGQTIAVDGGWLAR